MIPDGKQYAKALKPYFPALQSLTDDDAASLIRSTLDAGSDSDIQGMLTELGKRVPRYKNRDAFSIESDMRSLFGLPLKTRNVLEPIQEQGIAAHFAGDDSGVVKAGVKAMQLPFQLANLGNQTVQIEPTPIQSPIKAEQVAPQPVVESSTPRPSLPVQPNPVDEPDFKNLYRMVDAMATVKQAVRDAPAGVAERVGARGQDRHKVEERDAFGRSMQESLRLRREKETMAILDRLTHPFPSSVVQPGEVAVLPGVTSTPTTGGQVRYPGSVVQPGEVALLPGTTTVGDRPMIPAIQRTPFTPAERDVLTGGIDRSMEQPIARGLSSPVVDIQAPFGIPAATYREGEQHPSDVPEFLLTPVRSVLAPVEEGVRRMQRGIRQLDAATIGSVVDLLLLSNPATAGKVASGKAKALMRGLSDVGLGLGDVWIGTMPMVAGVNALGSAAVPLAGTIGERLGGKETGEAFAHAVELGTRLAFGPRIALAITASEYGQKGVQRLLDNAEWAQGMSDDDKDRLITAAGHAMFFAPLMAGRYVRRGGASEAKQTVRNAKEYVRTELGNILREGVKREYTPDEMKAVFQRVNRGIATAEEEALVRVINEQFSSPGEAVRKGTSVERSTGYGRAPKWLSDWLGPIDTAPRISLRDQIQGVKDATQVRGDQKQTGGAGSAAQGSEIPRGRYLQFPAEAGRSAGIEKAQTPEIPGTRPEAGTRELIEGRKPVPQLDAGKQGQMHRLMGLQSEILQKSGIPEEDMANYALDSTADGAKLRSYAEEVSRGEMTADDAAVRVQSDYRKMIEGRKEAPVLEAAGAVEKPIVEMTDEELSAELQELHERSNERGEPFTADEEKRSAAIGSELWRRGRAEEKKQLEEKRKQEWVKGHAEYVDPGPGWGSKEFAKANKNPRIAAYLKTTDKPDYAGYSGFITRMLTDFRKSRPDLKSNEFSDKDHNDFTEFIAKSVSVESKESPEQEPVSPVESAQPGADWTKGLKPQTQNLIKAARKAGRDVSAVPEIVDAIRAHNKNEGLFASEDMEYLEALGYESIEKLRKQAESSSRAKAVLGLIEKREPAQVETVPPAASLVAQPAEANLPAEPSAQEISPEPKAFDPVRIVKEMESEKADGGLAIDWPRMFLRPAVEKLERGGWHQLVELAIERSDQQGHMTEPAQESMKWLKGKGYIQDIAWDRRGRPHYAKTGEKLPAWLTRSKEKAEVEGLPNSPAMDIAAAAYDPKNRRYELNVPYDKRNLAKYYGARWAPEIKKWVYYEDEQHPDRFPSQLEQYLPRSPKYKKSPAAQPKTPGESAAAEAEAPVPAEKVPVSPASARAGEAAGKMPREVTKYIDAIRNAEKKDYARAYAAWLSGGRQGESPEYDGEKLSTMAAQAVRMSLEEVFEKAEPPAAEIKPVEAAGEMPIPKTPREKLAMEIAEATRKPMDKIAELEKGLATNGKWYYTIGNTLPIGVSWVKPYQHQSAGFAFVDKNGSVYGSSVKTREELESRYKAARDKEVSDFYEYLLTVDDAELKQQGKFHLKRDIEVPGKAVGEEVPAEREEKSEKPVDTFETYVSGIRSKQKRQYAEDVRAWVEGGRKGKAPTKPKMLPAKDANEVLEKVPQLVKPAMVGELVYAGEKYEVFPLGDGTVELRSVRRKDDDTPAVVRTMEADEYRAELAKREKASKRQRERLESKTIIPTADLHRMPHLRAIMGHTVADQNTRDLFEGVFVANSPIGLSGSTNVLTWSDGKGVTSDAAYERWLESDDPEIQRLGRMMESGDLRFTDVVDKAREEIMQWERGFDADEARMQAEAWGLDFDELMQQAEAGIEIAAGKDVEAIEGDLKDFFGGEEEPEIEYPFEPSGTYMGLEARRRPSIVRESRVVSKDLAGLPDGIRRQLISYATNLYELGYRSEEEMRDALSQKFGPKAGEFARAVQRAVKHAEQSLDDQRRSGASTHRPGIVLANGAKLPVPRDVVPASRYGKELDEHQRLGVNMALTRFEQPDGEAFGLFDGQGTGKTRIILTTAAEWAGRTGKPALIVAPSRQVIEQTYFSDAESLDVSFDNIEIGTYDDLRLGKIGREEYSVAIFDESHFLKNVHSMRSHAAEGVRADRRMYATGTPMDRPAAAAYFLSKLTGKPESVVQRMLGYEVRTRTVNGEERRYAVTLEGYTWEQVWNNIKLLRNRMIERGAMIRREFPFFGSLDQMMLPMTVDIWTDQNSIDAYWQQRIASARSPNAKKNLAGQRIGELSRWVESKKLDETLDMVRRELDAGRSVVVVAESVNPSEIKALDGESVPGFLTTLADRLKAAGIKHARIYGGNRKAVEIDMFQNNRVRVALMTPQSGGTGVSLDDTQGTAPRTMLIVTSNWSGDLADQMLYRVSRRNTVSPAKIVYLPMEGALADARRQQVIAAKLRTLEAVQRGDDPDDAIGFNPGQESEFEQPSEPDGKLIVERYSDRSIIVRGDTLQFKDRLRALKDRLGVGIWSPVQQGWIFPLKHADAVTREFKDVLDTGQEQLLKAEDIGDQPVEILSDDDLVNQTRELLRREVQDPAGTYPTKRGFGISKEIISDEAINDFVKKHEIQDSEAASQLRLSFDDVFELTGAPDYNYRRSKQKRDLHGKPSGAVPGEEEAREEKQVALAAAALKSPTDPEAWRKVFADSDRASSLVLQYINGEKPDGDWFRGYQIRNAADFASVLMVLRSRYAEMLKVAWLDDQNRIIDLRIVSLGTVNAAITTPREIFGSPPSKRCIISHNHPSGMMQYSNDDIAVTRDVLKAANLLEIEVVDHVVTDGGRYLSMTDTDNPVAEVRGYGSPKIDPSVKAIPPMEKQAKWEALPAKQLKQISGPNDVGPVIRALRQADAWHGHAIILLNNMSIARVARFPLPDLDADIDAYARDLAKNLLEQSYEEGGLALILDVPLSTNKTLSITRMVGQYLERSTVGIVDIASNDDKSFAEKGLLLREPGKQYDMFGPAPERAQARVETSTRPTEEEMQVQFERAKTRLEQLRRERAYAIKHPIEDSAGQQRVLASVRRKIEAAAREVMRLKHALDKGLFATPDLQETLFEPSEKYGSVRTDTPEFKRWFGQSKVVDKTGKPLRVYHGTKANISVFKISESGALGPGIYFTDNPDEASEYAKYAKAQKSKGYNIRQPDSRTPKGANVIPVYLSIQKPWTGSIEAFDKRFGWITGSKDYSSPGEEIIRNAQKAGYDGIIVDAGKGVNNYVVFSPRQVKSVYNRGTFDSNNPNILREPEFKMRFGTPERQIESGAMDFVLKDLPKSFTERVQDPKMQDPGAYNPITDEIRVKVLNGTATLHELGHRFFLRYAPTDLHNRVLSLTEQMDKVIGKKAADEIRRNYPKQEWGFEMEAEMFRQVSEKKEHAWVRARAFAGRMFRLFPEKFKSWGIQKLAEMLFGAYRMAERVMGWVKRAGARERATIADFLAGKSGFQKHQPASRRPMPRLSDALMERLTEHGTRIWGAGKRTSNEFADELISVYGPEVRPYMAAVYRATVAKLSKGNPQMMIFERDIALPAESRMQTFLRVFQDRFSRVLQAQKAIERAGGQVVPEEAPYLKEELHYGKIEKRLEEFEDAHVKPLASALAAAKQQGIEYEDVIDYLYAVHAPDRNKQIAKINPDMPDGGSGMTNEEAASVIDALKADGKLGPEMDAVAKEIWKINRAAREIIRGNLESEETVAAWEDAYGEHYVPLKSGEADHLGGQATGTGFSVSRSGVRRALGRRSRAENLIENSISQYVNAVIRDEKNKVGQAFLSMVIDNPDRNLWEINKVPMKRVLTRNGIVMMVPDWKGTFDDEYFRVTENGKVVFVHIKDPVLARQLKRLYEGDLVGEWGRAIVNGLGAFTRYVVMINTAKNPEFMFVNFVRDAQTAGINMSADKLGKVTGTVAKSLPRAIAGIASAEFAQGQGEWARWYDRYKSAGAKVAFFRHDPIADIRKDLLARIRMATASRAQNLRKHPFLMLGRPVIQAIEKMNNAIENGVRLSTFRALVEAGTPEPVAASYSKNLTVNFNRKGEIGPVLNAMWAFSNASIQGTARMAQAVKGPYGRRIAAGLFLMGLLGAELQRLLAGEDEIDGRNRYDKLESWVKDSHLIFFTEDDRYIRIPLPYGLGVFYAAGAEINSMLHGKPMMSKPGEKEEIAGGALSDFFSTMLTNLNPLGSGPMIQVFAPTAFEPVVQSYTNENFFGAPIRPEATPYETPGPDAERFFESARPVSRTLARQLNEVTGGNEFRPGWMDFSPNTLDFWWDFATGGAGKTVANTITTLSNLARGEKTPVENIPVIRRFVGREKEGVVRERFYSLFDEQRQLKAELDAMLERSTDTETLNTWQNRNLTFIRFVDALGDLAYTTPGGETRAHTLESVQRTISGLRKQERLAREQKEYETADRLRKEQTDMMKRVIGIYNRIANETEGVLR